MPEVTHSNGSKWISILFAILPILDTYELKFAPVSFGEVVLIFIVIYIIFEIARNRKTLLLSNGIYPLFLLYAFFASLLVGLVTPYFEFSEWFFKWARIFLYSFSFITIAFSYIDTLILARAFSIIGIIISVFQLAQSIFWYVFHKAIFLIIPLFRLHYNISDYATYSQNLMRWNGAGWRPSNFFLEPAQYSLYAGITLVAVLFYCTENKIKAAILITIGVLFSGSATGIILIGTIWIYWILSQKKYVNIKTLCIFTAILIIIVLYFVTDNPIKEGLRYRLGTIGEVGSSTGSLRILRGFSIFRQLNLLQQLFGTGLGNFGSFLITSRITTRYDSGLTLGNEYMSAFTYILNNTGLVGTGIFISFVAHMFKRNKGEKVAIAYLILWVIMILATSNFITSYYMLPLVFVTALSSKYSCN